jgi:hypothetical protein
VRKLMCASVVTLVAFGAVGYAQDVEHKSKTKISVKDGKEVTLTGCVVRSPEGNFILSHAAGKDGSLGSYTLVAEDAGDFDDHVGHRVEVKGKAADQGSGKVKIESKTEVDAGAGEKKKRESKTEVEGDLEGLPFLGVKSIKTLATVCP